MKLKSLNKRSVLRQILPSLFFIVCIALYIGAERGLIINLVAAGLALLLIGNMILQNKIINIILGGIFLLGSFYMLFAIYSDFVNGKAVMGYFVVALLILASILMSILLISNCENKKGVN